MTKSDMVVYPDVIEVGENARSFKADEVCGKAKMLRFVSKCHKNSLHFHLHKQTFFYPLGKAPSPVVANAELWISVQISLVNF